MIDMCGRMICTVYSICIDLGRQERPYHSDSTASRLLSEVKHCRARLVLRWGTTLESLVLFFCSFLLSCQPLVAFYGLHFLFILLGRPSFLLLLE